MTTTKTETIQSVLDRADPNLLADALRRLGLGKMQAVVKVVATGLTAAASFDITTPEFAALAGVVITGIDDPEPAGEGLPAVGSVLSLRCTASGTANSVGSYAIGDVAATMLSPTASTVVGLARISDDGKTITFPTTVTGFTLQYMARPAVPPTTQFNDYV